MGTQFFDGLVVDRQMLFWAVVTRRQLERWEASVAEIVRLGFKSTAPPGQLVWLAEADRHFVFVAARNLLRAGQLQQEAVFDQDLAENVRTVRDLLEHWDENIPVFNVTPQRRVPPRQSGKIFSAQHPGKTPFSSFVWNSKDGPMLAPNVPAQLIHELLDHVESTVLGKRPELREYLPEYAASPWLGEEAGQDRWWPKPSAT